MSPARQLDGLIDKFTPEVAACARTALAKMRQRLPGALELVYDNYNALAIGFAATERVSDVLFSIALYPRWVSLFWIRGVGLPDPQKLLRGSGKQVRYVVLADPATLDTPGVRALMQEALRRAHPPLDPSQPHRIVIKSISARQRPRRPA